MITLFGLNVVVPTRSCKATPYGVKPLIQQSELGTYTKVVPFQEKKFLSLCSIVKTTEWNGLIKIDN